MLDRATQTGGTRRLDEEVRSHPDGEDTDGRLKLFLYELGDVLCAEQMILKVLP